MPQVLAVADFEVEFRDYYAGQVISFDDVGVVSKLISRRVVIGDLAAIGQAVASGAQQLTHAPGFRGAALQPVLVDRYGSMFRPGGEMIGGVYKAQGFADARDFGIRNDDNDYSEELRTAITQACSAGVPVLFQPGWVIRYASTWQGAPDDFSQTISAQVTDGGGLVCLGGHVTLESWSPDWKHHLIAFRGYGFNPDSQKGRNLWVEGVRFNCATTPTSGLDGGALEAAMFLRVTCVEDVLIRRNKFENNFGAGVLLRHVDRSLVEYNEARNVFKDNFHITGNSRYGVRRFNDSYGSYDDAFATVGYASGSASGLGQPEHMYDINNRVFGTRGARSFAYVGAKHVRNVNCFADGQVPDFIPQKSSPQGWVYRTNCGLYVASESSFGTHGNEDIKVSGFQAVRLGPTVDATKALVTTGQDTTLGGSNTLAGITVDAGNSGQQNVDITIEATLKEIAKIGFRSAGAHGNKNIKLSLEVYDNTDPLGIRGAAGAYFSYAADVQNTAGLEAYVKLKRGGSGVITLNNTCSGVVKIKTHQEDICRNSEQDTVWLASGAFYESVEVDCHIESNLPESGVGKQDRIIDIQAEAMRRRFSVTGPGRSVFTEQPVSGFVTRTLQSADLGATSQILFNASPVPMQIAPRFGTNLTLKRSRLARRRVSNIVPGANGTFRILGENLTTALPAGAAIMFVGDGQSLDLQAVTPALHHPGASTVVSATLSGSDTVVTCANVPAQMTTVRDAAGTGTTMVPAETYWREVAFILAPWSSAIGGSPSRMFSLGPNQALLLEYTAKPALVTVYQSEV